MIHLYGYFLQVMPADSLRIVKAAIEAAKLHTISDTAYNVWVNGALSLVGSIVGALVAVWIAVWTLKRSSKVQLGNEVRKNIKLRRDKLRYFGMLVNSVMNTANTNNIHLKDCIQRIEADKTNFQPLTITPNSDLKRISEDLELESYMLAMADEPQIQNGIQEFGAVMNNVDYLFNEFQVLPDLVERAGTITSKYQSDVKDTFEEIRKVLQRIMSNLNNYNVQVANDLMEIYNNIVMNGAISMDLLYNHGFVLFNNVAVAALAVQRDENMESIGYLSLKGKEHYLNLIRENETYLEILKSIQVRIEDAYNELLATNQVQLMFPNG